MKNTDFSRWLIELVPQYHQLGMTLYYAGYFDHSSRNMCPATTYHVYSSPTWDVEFEAASVAHKLQPIPGYAWIAREHRFIYCAVPTQSTILRETTGE